jgi:hypothetical protein
LKITLSFRVLISAADEASVNKRTKERDKDERNRKEEERHQERN